MTHLYVCVTCDLAACTYAKRLIHFDTNSYMFVTQFSKMRLWHDSFICVCDMIHLYVCVTWFIYTCMCDLLYARTRNNEYTCPFTCVTWLINLSIKTAEYPVTHSTCFLFFTCMCDMTYLYLWHDSFICLLDCRVDMIQSHVCLWLATCTCAKWRMWCDSIKFATWLIQLSIRLPSSLHQVQLVCCTFWTSVHYYTLLHAAT